MLPNTENTDDLVLDFLETEEQKTQTFSLNPHNSNYNASGVLGACVLGKAVLGATKNASDYYIGGKIDGLLALQQYILLMLSVEADKYIIYPYTWGIVTLDLIGKPPHYVIAVVPERIKETLLSDERITDVTDFEFEINGNKLNVKFIVHTIYGDLEEEMVVNY